MKGSQESVDNGKLISRKTLSLRRAATALLFGGIIGKLAGILREVALAAAFGTTTITAGLRVAQTATLVPLNLLIGDSLNSAFLPLHIRAKENSSATAQDLYISIQRALLAVSVLITVGFVVFAPQIVQVISPGLEAGTKSISASFIRLMAVGVPFFVSGAISSYLALSEGAPRLVSLRSTFLNVGILLGIVTAWYSGAIIMLAAGFTCGCVGFSAVAGIYLRASGIYEGRQPRVTLSASWKLARPFLNVMRGLVVIPVAVACSTVFQRVAGSFLGEQVVAATQFASLVTETGVALLGVPLGLAALASTRQVDSDLDVPRRTATSLIGPILLLILPVSAVCTVAASNVVEILYQRGSFDVHSSEITATLLRGFAIGQWAQIVGYVLVRVYSSTLRVNRIARIQASAVLVEMLIVAVAIPTNQPIWIGLGASAYATIVVLVTSIDLGVWQVLGRFILLLAPPVIVYAVCWSVFGGSGVAQFSIWTGGFALLWILYCLTVKPLRRELMKLKRIR